jgi:hypothetical protein
MKMRALIAITVGAVASLCFPSFEAQACGESLFRVGRGVAYRSASAPLPGNILVVSSRPESKQLAERLAAAGHRVRVVDSMDQVAQEIRGGEYDVVLGAFNDRERIEQQTAGVDKAPAYVPVTTEDAQKELAAKAYPRYLSADDDFTQFLRIIHRTLKAAI